jgi:tetratricopeptide (TPR) repeat protein
MNAPKTKVLLVVGAIILFVLLFIAPKVIPLGQAESNSAEGDKKPDVSENATLSVYLSLANKNLAPLQKQKLDKFILSKMEDSLIGFWDRSKRPDLASFYSEEVAKRSNTAKLWFNAGNRYYYAVQFSQDKTEIPVLYQCALRCFNKGLKLDPTNTDAKIMQASCYVEGTSEPMEGVSRLREIEKTDSNNVKLQLTFAFFSLKSGQLDKAVRRFKKVIAVDSSYIEAYLHLADTYERQGDIEKTISALETYALKTDDVTAKIEINKYIQQLKNK